jgi:succinoglycan biosynthesis protein ExoA
VTFRHFSEQTRERETRRIRRVSIVSPMLNEADHVEDFVADLAAQDYDGDTQLLVADGGSSDGSAELLLSASERHDLPVTVIENAEGWVSHGLNLCIQAATGDLIVRLDCHSRYPPEYLRRCVVASEETGADNVGGVLIPAGRTPMERAVAYAANTPFGGVHWTRHNSFDRVEVDTVPYGAFRPEVFRRVGLFDESLLRNQDDEFNLRLRLAGGRVVRDPSIRVFYVPRGTFRGLFRQYYEYGRWKAPVMQKHGRATSARSLVPGAFVGSVIALALVAPWVQAARLLLAAELSLYLLAAVFFGLVCVRRMQGSWGLLPRVVAVFPTLHVAYGLGMLVGWARSIVRPRPIGRRLSAP